MRLEVNGAGAELDMNRAGTFRAGDRKLVAKVIREPESELG